MGTTHYPPEVRAQAVAAYVAGATSTEVGKQFGTSPQTIATWVKAAGKKVRKPGSTDSLGGFSESAAMRDAALGVITVSRCGRPGCGWASDLIPLRDARQAFEAHPCAARAAA